MGKLKDFIVTSVVLEPDWDSFQLPIMGRKAMITEIDLLREDIPRLEKKFGCGNLFVQVLKAQLASLQTKPEQRIAMELSLDGFVNQKTHKTDRELKH